MPTTTSTSTTTGPPCIEHDTTFTAADGVSTLRATLAVPEGSGPFPAALLLVGSGPLDRDSNMKRQRLNVTAELAAALAAVGIATLRFDKRGAGRSDGTFKAAGLHDNIADAALALAHLGAAGLVDDRRLLVIGHSAGALIATELAARADQVGLVGVGLLAGMSGTGREVLEWQVASLSDMLPGPVRLLLKLFRIDLAKAQRKRMATLERTTTDTVRMQGVKVNARWFREFMAFDPVPRLSKITVPTLAITGAADIQVPPGDVATIGETVAGPFEGSTPDDLSHIFRLDPDRRGLRGYRAAMKQPVDADFLNQVTSWAVRATLGIERRQG